MGSCWRALEGKMREMEGEKNQNGIEWNMIEMKIDGVWSNRLGL